MIDALQLFASGIDVVENANEVPILRHAGVRCFVSLALGDDAPQAPARLIQSGFEERSEIARRASAIVVGQRVAGRELFEHDELGVERIRGLDVHGHAADAVLRVNDQRI